MTTPENAANTTELASASVTGATSFPNSLKTNRSIQLLTALFLIEFVLLTGYVLTSQYPDLPKTAVRLFSLDNELNFGSWFSAAQLMMIGFIMLGIFWFGKNSKWADAKLFFSAGLIFIFLSADEALAIHESISGILGKSASWVRIFPTYIWITVYIIIGLIILIAFRNSIMLIFRDHSKQACQGLFGSLVYALGAIGIESANYHNLFQSTVTQVGIEEMLEMMGASLILVAALELLLKVVRIKPIEGSSS